MTNDTSLRVRLEYGQPQPPVTELPDNLYRVKHDIELPASTVIMSTLTGGVGREVLMRKARRVIASANPTVTNVLWRKNVPEVFWMKPLHRVYQTKAWQELWFELFTWGAPNLGRGEYARKKWAELNGCHRAFSNNVGLRCKRPEPHGPFADYINNENMGSTLPAFDKPRFTGGATVRATLRDGKYWISTLTKPIPIEQLIQEPWHYFQATTVHEDGTIGRFPQGDGSPVLVPLVSTEPVHYPIEYLEKVSEIADPYAI